MDRPIARRDFLNGVAMAGAVSAVGLGGLQACAATPGQPYPPALTGLRGSHPGSFEPAHELRDAGSWQALHQSATTLPERYDLIVVGGGLSGLAAAYFYRQKHGFSARILILENHDDFGGHAKRNEFTHEGRTYIGYGGTEQIYHGPWEYSDTALKLIKEIGVETDRFYTAFDWTRYQRMRLKEGIFLDKENFGEDHLAVGIGELPAAQLLAKAPLSELAKRQLVQLYEGEVDFLAGKTPAEKYAIVSKLTYAEFLTTIVKADPSVVAFLWSATVADRDSRSIETLSFQSALDMGLPGTEALGLATYRVYKHHARNPEQIFHFPDGNAGVARLLVRSLIPGALPGKTQEDQVTARLDYSKLDEKSSPVRIRLSSIAVNVRNVGDPQNARDVEAIYLKDGKAFRVRAGQAVLACFNSLIPMLVPDLPARQKEGLSWAIRSPLVYTNVLVRNWRAFAKLGVHYIHAPTAYYTETKLDFPVDLGDYRSASSPDEPIMLHLEKRFWNQADQPWLAPASIASPDAYKYGRASLLSTPWEDMELEVRSSLARHLGAGGFDPAEDILGITVNRWPHGYARFPDFQFDPHWAGGTEPWVIGRQRFGRIAIANSDSAARPLTQAAIDMAARAVDELTA
jgi:spermidine dehydrogenase